MYFGFIIMVWVLIEGFDYKYKYFGEWFYNIKMYWKLIIEYLMDDYDVVVVLFFWCEFVLFRIIDKLENVV